jgi:prepilin-type N-terminal cleavage/methylation domain-containing protein
MKKQIKNEKGFTLIELVMVIAILGILSAAAMPLFADLTADAHAAARDGMVGAIRGGINTLYAKAVTDPAIDNEFVIELDGENGGPCTNCFHEVLSYPVSDGSWSKTGENSYMHVATGMEFDYDPNDGTFRVGGGNVIVGP